MSKLRCKYKENLQRKKHTLHYFALNPFVPSRSTVSLLFTVFRKVTPNAELSDEGRVKKGSPHTPVLQRDFRWGRAIPGKGEMTIRMSWMGDMDKTHMFDNWQIEYHKRDLLPVGDYFVEFDQEIDFALYKNLNTKFKIDFEID